MKWSYKTVHFELKKEGILGSGFLDESEIEQELNEYGMAGWELVSVLEVHDGMIAFFRQPLGIARTAGTPDAEDADRGSGAFQQQDISDETVAFRSGGEVEETREQREIPVEDGGPGIGGTTEETREDRDEDDTGIGAIRIE